MPLSNESEQVRWTTSQILDWMTNFTDSKEGIKVKIMNIVQENDLDGHALKQLRDEPEELHELLPVLKERLTFKAMMKKLFGPTNSQKPNFGSSRPQPSPMSSREPQSPLQLPSTSFESSPLIPISRQVSQLTYNEGSRSVNNMNTAPLLSSSQSITTQAGLVSQGHEEGTYQAVYPTGILTETPSSQFLPTQSSVYGTQVSVSEGSAPPSSSSDYQNLSNPADMETSPDPEDDLVSNPMRRSPSARKALEFTRKYRKILQKVKSTPPGGDNYMEAQIPYPAPLPTFSTTLRQQIERGNLLSFKTRFVYECAQFYMTINPTPTHTAYRNISMTIVNKYPELADQFKHKEAWKSFNTSLSQAIRNIRRRLRSVPGTGFPPASRRYHQKHTRNLDDEPAVANIKQEIEDKSNIQVVASDATPGSSNEVSETVLAEDDDDLLESLEMPEDIQITIDTIDDDSGPETSEIVVKAERCDTAEEQPAATVE